MVCCDPTNEQMGLYVWLSMANYGLQWLKHSYLDKSDQKAVTECPLNEHTICVSLCLLCFITVELTNILQNFLDVEWQWNNKGECRQIHCMICTEIHDLYNHNNFLYHLNSSWCVCTKNKSVYIFLWTKLYWDINTLKPRKNGRHFADDIFKCIFLNENVWIPIKISLSLFLRVQLTIFQHWFR